MKANCYQCVYRGEIPGDAHSRCSHPAVKQDDNPIGALIQMLAGENDAAQVKLNIRANPQGVRHGWFLWPATFDPRSLVNCDGFKPREEARV
jgi:hypothetical protein